MLKVVRLPSLLPELSMVLVRHTSQVQLEFQLHAFGVGSHAHGPSSELRP